MKFSDIKTENELKLWSQNQHLKWWVILPLILGLLFTFYLIIFERPHQDICEGMSEKECGAYSETMGNRDDRGR